LKRLWSLERHSQILFGENLENGVIAFVTPAITTGRWSRAGECVGRRCGG
jgi:hypothetical protein